MHLDFTNDQEKNRTISPFRELGAYEAMWADLKTSFRSIAKIFSENQGAIPSDFIEPAIAERYANAVQEKFHASNIESFGVRVHGAAEYPEKLRDAAEPIELLYYQGCWDLINSRSVAVVGTRKPSKEGRDRTRRLVKLLIKDNFSIVSGLAAGIDREAHSAALDFGGRTIAVIGTPLSHFYPKENSKLQRKISKEYLLISQVPVHRYESQDIMRNKVFFPERNKTMSALTEATIIVEAGETSGTRIQAKAALQQGRKLFILNNCFNNPALTWPRLFEKRGAIRVREYDDIRQALSK